MIRQLGQSGLIIELEQTCILVDPYLSNSVQELDSPDLARLVPIKFSPHAMTNVDWVLITHEHLDHCDPKTLPFIADASPAAKFIGPEPARKKLKDWKLPDNRIVSASPEWVQMCPNVFVRAVPAAHPKITMAADGQPRAVGYIFQRQGRRTWIAGDTSVTEDLICSLKPLLPIKTAFLPVNEDNFFRRRRGIVGNMSIREAFGLAAELGISQVIPVHWDLFEANNTTSAEIHAVFDSYSWPFKLLMNTEAVCL